MMWLGYGSGWMGIWMVLLWGGVVALIVWGIRASSTPRRDRVGSGRAILEERFARGEIDRSEFEERARALERSHDDVRSGKTLLAAGIVAVLIGLIGMSASIQADGGWWESRGGWPGFSHGRMMGWSDDSDNDEPAPALFDDAEEYRIVAGDLFFEPSSLTVRAETPVNITVVNEGRVFHKLTIAEFDFNLNADPGESASGGLGGLSPGEYRFECTVPGHAQAGMVGTLIVES